MSRVKLSTSFKLSVDNGSAILVKSSLVKEQILNRLRQGSPVSGEQLGKDIGISRTAIWKHIKELRREGYQISSSPNKGYLFVSAPDRLLPEEIKSGLMTHILGQLVIFHQDVSSTQDAAKMLASQGAVEGTIIVAEVQTEGRGRIGRRWISLPEGIYFSIILRPDIQPTEALKLPLIAGVAVAQAIKEVTNVDPKLKWPNDIFIADRKVGGILTEMSAEMDRLDWVIVGIGLNVNAPKDSFSDEIQEIATSLQIENGNPVSRVKLLQTLLSNLESLYDEFKKNGFESTRARWKDLSNTIGAEVAVYSGAELIEGQAVDIDSDGALVVQTKDGNLQRIIAGDVSLKLGVRRPNFRE